MNARLNYVLGMTALLALAGGSGVRGYNGGNGSGRGGLVSGNEKGNGIVSGEGVRPLMLVSKGGYAGGNGLSSGVGLVGNGIVGGQGALPFRLLLGGGGVGSGLFIFGFEKGLSGEGARNGIINTGHGGGNGLVTVGGDGTGI
ncbi:hypothetical protein [Spirosoma linguale]|uniref:Uncharacterized protein n=1 Tax=Spirosoma linguale (strain ATCC 33905 / DSM 74 / LMG 10896 / Claus 1) TaxID=504472 RepID=D2QQN7_SPILD|nr:conserved hypothetical protein [Spirosoma linguale DSM 74]